MKPKFSPYSRLLPLATAIVASVSLASTAFAVDVTWDTVPSDSLVTGGLGTWDTATANWTTNAGVSNINWVNGSDVAVFGGTAGAVTLGAPITAGGLTFNNVSGTYQITGAQVLTLSGTTPTITVTTPLVTTTILSVITGTNGLTKEGAGILNLQTTAANTFTGVIDVNDGQVSANAASVLTDVINPATTLDLNNGAFAFLGRNNSINSQTFAGTTLAGGETAVRLNSNGTGTDTLVLGPVTRAAGTTLTLSIGFNTGPTVDRQIQSSSWAAGTILDSGVAYATFVANANGAPAPFTANDWASYSGTKAQAATYTFSTATTLAGNADIDTGIDTTLAADATITTLRSNFAESRIIDINGNILTTGGILIGSTVGTETTTITGGTLRSAATASGKDLVVIANNSGATVINSNISNAAAGATGLTKTGPGNLTLGGTNSYTGPTIIGGGSLTSSLAAALSTTPSVFIGGGSGLTVSYGGPSSYSNPQITTLLAKTTFEDATSAFGFDTTDATGGTADYAGGYSGSTGLAKSGTGTLVMTGANSHTGITSIFGGTMKIVNTGALGTTANGTSVSDGATLSIDGNMTITGEALSILGDGVSSVGALHSISGNNAWTGPISSTGTGRINAAAGTLAITEIGASGTIALSGNGAITVADVNGTAGVTVQDLLGDGTTSGIVTLPGANTNTGTVAVASGRLDLTGNRTANSGALTAGIDAFKTGTLNLSNGTFSLIDGEDITVGGGADSIGILNQTGGSVTTGATPSSFVLLGQGINSTGTYNLSAGTLNVGGTNSNAFILGVADGSTGIFNLSGTGTVQALSPGLASLQIGRSNNSAAAGTTGEYNQTGGSTSTILNDLAMGGGGVNNDSTTSILTVTGGTFTVNDEIAALSAGPNSSSTITIGGTADVTLPRFPTARGAGSTATITFDGGTLRPTAASATYMGGLDSAKIQDGGVTIDVPTGNDIVITQDLLTDDVSLGGGLTKTGDGALVLAGANSYTGPTIISGGIFGLDATGVIDPASSVSVASGATFGGSGTASGAVTSSGSIRPGTLGVGTLTTGTTTLTAGSLDIDVSDASAGKLLSSGPLNVTNIDLNVSELAVASVPSFVIAEGSSITGPFNSENLPDGYSVTITPTTVVLNTGVSAGYDDWAIDNSIPGELATDDFDKDGLTNLEEYALGLNPTTSSVPAGTFTGGTLTFIKGADAIANGDVSWEIQTSSTLGNDWVGQVTQAAGDPTATISYTLPTAGPKLFARLKVVKIP